MKSRPPPKPGAVDVTALLQYVKAGGRMGVASLQTSGGRTRVWFRDGRLVDAESSEATGEAAVSQVLSTAILSYTIEYRPIARFPVIHDDAVALLGKRTRRSVEWQRLVSSMPSLESHLAVNDVRYARESNSLADVDVELLSLVDGRRAIAEVVAGSGLDAVETMQRLAWYFRTGLIRLARGRRAPSNLQVRRARRAAPEEPPASDSEESGPVPIASIRPLPMIPVDSRSLAQKEGSRPSSVPPPGSRATLMMYARSLPSRNTRAEVLTGPRVVDPVAADGSEPSPSGEQQRARTPVEESNPFPSLQGAVRGGHILLGRYEVLSRIARGGMGTVYLCRATGEGGFHRLFALKVLRSHLVRDAAAVQRFREEARIAANLYDPHVVGVVDVSSQEGQPFIVMDYVQGGTLQELLRRHPKYRPPRLIVPVILDALSGLHALHTLEDEDGTPLGLVHCDVSPHNLLVGVDGNCRLSDFGVARLRATGSESGRDVRHGKPAYVSPEQISGGRLDARTDLFSMGIILWTALTGERLFEASTHEGTLANVRNMPIYPPSQMGLRPPPCFDQICRKALSRNPDSRYASARDMFVELRSLALVEGHLGAPSEVADWVEATFGAELRVQRLGAIQASARERARSVAAYSVREPPRGPATTGGEGKPTSTTRPSRRSTTGTAPTLVLPRFPSQKRVLIAAAIIGALAIVVTLAWPGAIAGLFAFELEADTPVDVTTPTPPPPNVRGQSAPSNAWVPRHESAQPIRSPGAATGSGLHDYVPMRGVE